ncbi:TetR/AcrR family transcriptional regulator [Petropleomorpha daqingensis]|uniref:AcrR family transcriptional regulator n=1 Tax=Petropleomorpha daqingensis TaxID=2026353 RepID=A0A853CIB0_9ACTN|nr:AcrR family transcriptional regulator [Petropleomorpha daqingensis]
MTETAVPRDRRADRHAATKSEIVAAAWRLARERGLGAWSLRDVAREVGMQAPSLYGYFASKNAVFDAMFAEGCAELASRVEEAAASPASPVEKLRASAPLFFDFCVEDPARFQLLFLRVVPGFEPSPESYALAQIALDRLAEVLAAAGMGSPELVDLWTALTTGLASQQVSNDPGGDRWRRLLEPAVEMFLARHLPEGAPARS